MSGSMVGNFFLVARKIAFSHSLEPKRSHNYLKADVTLCSTAFWAAFGSAQSAGSNDAPNVSCNAILGSTEGLRTFISSDMYFIRTAKLAPNDFYRITMHDWRFSR